MSETSSTEYAPSPDSPPPIVSETSPQNAPSTPPTLDHLPGNPDLGGDIIMWRRKQLNVVILGIATATWVLLEVYQYSFITLVSYAAMAFLVCCFLWGNMHRLLKREAPELSELEIKEETAMEHAKLVKQWAEQVIRLMLHVSAERQVFVFAGVVTCLYLISLVSAYLDFLTISYIGIVGGMTIPVIYVKKEQKIREIGERLRTKLQRLQGIMEEKIWEMKSRIAGKHEAEIKEKKQE